jgi:putative endonuclease
MSQWHFYIIRTVDRFLYAGVATDVDRRFSEHRRGGVRSAKYLRAHKPLKVEFSQLIGEKGLALKVEYRFKLLSKNVKESIVRLGRMDFDGKTGAIHLPGRG